MAKQENSKMGVVQMIFMIIGIISTVVFVIVAIIIAAIIIIKPYGVDVIEVVPAIIDPNPTSSYDHPYLTTQQEAIVESAGIDPEDIPTALTPVQQQCAIAELGQERAFEIVSGSTPSITEILKVKHCFE